MLKYLICYLFVASSFQGAIAADLSIESPRAVLYKRGSNFTKVLFRYEKSVSEVDGKKSVVSSFFHPDGKLALEEKINYRKDGSMQDYWRMQHQIEEETKMEREGEKVRYYRKKKGEEDRDDEKWRDDIITTDQMVSYVQEHWLEIIGGKELELRVLIPSRMDTVGFTVLKSKEEGDVKGKKTIIIRMQPTSMFIRAFVDPILFHYEAGDSKRLLMVDGRMAVKKLSPEGKYSDAHGQLLFEYEKVAAPPTVMEK